MGNREKEKDLMIKRMVEMLKDMIFFDHTHHFLIDDAKERIRDTIMEDKELIGE